MTLYHVLGAVAALALGVWLGMPGKYGSSWRTGRRTGDEADRATQEATHDPRHLAELEGALARENADSKTTKRHFTLFGGLISPKQRASVRRRGRRGRFQTSVPQPVDDHQKQADEQP